MSEINDTGKSRAGFGHNRGHVPPEELKAELAALQEAEARTITQHAKSPSLIDYIYEVRFYPGGELTRGDLKAYDIKHARRSLNVILGVTQLPMDTQIIEKHIVEEELKEWNAAKSRRLLQTLMVHHVWLQGSAGGVRADLSGEDLSGVNLEGRDLSHVSLANANLSGAALKGARLIGTDLTGVDLSGADLSGCDLTNASLADANLIGTKLTGTNLKGADLWRANLARAVISPEALHKALGCSEG